MLAADEWLAVRLTLELAGSATFLLLLFGTPLAWWLARSRSRWATAIEASVALPLILPPTVLGLYLLLCLGPQGSLGRLVAALGWRPLPFSFRGLVLASVIYSLPFVVQPLRDAFRAVGDGTLEAAANLGAGRLDRFFSVALPLSRQGFATAGILVFTHTVGEFGVVLMIGGNIPGQTRVLSVLIYDQVEAMNFGRAGALSALLVAFSFLALLGLGLMRSQPRR